MKLATYLACFSSLRKSFLPGLFSLLALLEEVLRHLDGYNPNFSTELSTSTRAKFTDQRARDSEEL